MDRQTQPTASTGLSIKKIGLVLTVSLALFLSACGAFGEQTATLTPTQNVTQAYQTVEARLTQAIAQTPTITRTPTIDPDATGTSTPTPTSTLTPTPTLPEPTLSPTPGCDRAAAGSPLDLTIPDDTQLAPREAFTKEWSVVNAGSCTWTTDYQLVWVSGDMLSAPSAIDLPARTDPGEKVALSVDMIAPAAPGTYQSNWKLQNAAGLQFGLGPAGQGEIWVRIIVTDAPAATQIPTESADATPTPSETPEGTPPPSPTPERDAAGTITLLLGSGIDLDAPPGAGAGTFDLVFDLLGGETPWLIPQPGVLMSIFGELEPGQAECQAAALSDAPLPVESLPSGFYLCYQTDQGQSGWVQLISYDPEASLLILEYRTWGS
jgi:hypothetical protein